MTTGNTTLATALTAPEGKPERSSRLPGFYKLSVEERREALTREGWLSREGAMLLAQKGAAPQGHVSSAGPRLSGEGGVRAGLTRASRH